MGSVLASRFHAVPSLTTSLIAGGNRGRRLRQEGITVNGTTTLLPVIDPETSQGSETAPLDLIIVALKHHHLPEAIPGLDPVVGPKTIFISVMNGLDSEHFIGEHYGMDKVPYCISVGIDALRQNGDVTYTTVGTLQFGDATNDPAQPSPRVQRVQHVLAAAAIPYEVPPDMLRVLWWKFMVNVGVNQASAMMRAPYRAFQRMPDARAVMFGLMREVLALAAAEDVHLDEDDLPVWDKFLQTLSPDGKTSMLQDIEAGRKTEVEIFAGKAVALGDKHGIPTPLNATALHVIRVLQTLGSQG